MSELMQLSAQVSDLSAEQAMLLAERARYAGLPGEQARINPRLAEIAEMLDRLLPPLVQAQRAHARAWQEARDRQEAATAATNARRQVTVRPALTRAMAEAARMDAALLDAAAAQKQLRAALHELATLSDLTGVQLPPGSERRMFQCALGHASPVFLELMETSIWPSKPVPIQASVAASFARLLA